MFRATKTALTTAALIAGVTIGASPAYAIDYAVDCSETTFLSPIISVFNSVSSTYTILNSSGVSCTNIAITGPLGSTAVTWTDGATANPTTLTAGGTLTVTSATSGNVVFEVKTASSSHSWAFLFTISGGGGSGSGGTPSSSTSSAAVQETLTLSTTTDGTTCTGGNPSGYTGSWLALPSADECTQTGPDARADAVLLGWSTSPNFPVARAQDQINRSWGVIDEEIGGIRMIFIPGGMSTFVSSSNTLYPIWSA
jgi:hypothetical protein